MSAHMLFWFGLAILAVTPLRAGDLESLSSAERCGKCHRAILQSWKRSSHAMAMESPQFQDVLQVAENELGIGVRRTCLTCHSPLALQINDTALEQKVTWEGVTCDYCHSLREVTLEGANPRARLEFTMVKSGPLKDATSSAHRTTYSKVHTSSAVCAPCHEHRNAQGFPVLSTYTEWQNSRYAKEGRECQSCHMYAVAGEVVDPKLKRSTGAKVNLHEMPGSHSINQLNKTIRAYLSTARENNKVKATVQMVNQGAGHYVPTGSPLRKLVLEVRADTSDGRRHFQQERVFQRVVADAKGAEMKWEHHAILKGVQALSDTRLAPDEKRTETFWFDIPPAVRAQVKATFWYYYSPLASTDVRKRVTFLSLSRPAP